MARFISPETCKALGLAPALGERAPASSCVPTHHLPVPGHSVEGEETVNPADPESKVSNCLELTCFHSILFSLSENTTINLLLSLI